MKGGRTIFWMLVACFALWGLLNNMTDNLVPAACFLVVLMYALVFRGGRGAKNDKRG